LQESLIREAQRELPDGVDGLLRHRVIMTLGKGGVGRTSVCAALAIVVARTGKRVLLMETDAGTPVAAGYGKKPGLVPLPLAPNLWGLFLGGQESLEDYLGMVVPRSILRLVLASSLYRYFVQAAPALRELLMMGKIYHEIVRRPKSEPAWDLIIVDMPASGQALSMLKMPFAAGETFGDSLVGREAQNVASFIRDRAQCTMVAVTTAEPLAVAETLDVERALKALELSLAAVIFNRIAPARFDTADVGRLLRRGMRQPRPKNLAALAEIAHAEVRRGNRQRRALGILARQMNAPLILLEECSLTDGPTRATALAAQLERYQRAAAEPVAARL
jgi:anion-transporting  ArsA/GET3 family ATPase